MARRKKVFAGKIGDVDLRLMRVFKTVIECSGLSAAQAELGIGASTISKQVSDLETRLGVHLCHRGRGGFSLTQQGVIALEHIDRLLAAADEFATNMAAVNNRLGGTIDIGMIDFTLADDRNPLIGAIGKFRETAPDVNVRLMTGTPAEVERGVIDGKLHLGIVPDYQRHPSLSALPLYEEEVGLFCADDHPVAQAMQTDAALTASQVETHALVHRGYFESGKVKKTKGRFPVGSIANQTEAVMALVHSGLYLGFFPVHCAEGSQANYLEVMPDSYRYTTPILAIWRTDRKNSVLLQMLLDFIRPNDD
ncbi:LysR family transcriptional regulator [Halovulum sp. GXIMD14793]